MNENWNLEKRNNFGWYLEGQNEIKAFWLPEVEFANPESTVSGNISESTVKILEDKLFNYSISLTPQTHLFSAIASNSLMAFKLSEELGGGFMIVLPVGLTNFQTIAIGRNKLDATTNRIQLFKNITLIIITITVLILSFKPFIRILSLNVEQYMFLVEELKKTGRNDLGDLTGIYPGYYVFESIFGAIFVLGLIFILFYLVIKFKKLNHKVLSYSFGIVLLFLISCFISWKIEINNDFEALKLLSKSDRRFTFFYAKIDGDINKYAYFEKKSYVSLALVFICCIISMFHRKSLNYVRKSE